MENIFPLFGEVGFDGEGYIEDQRRAIEERAKGQLFLEVGGKLLEDYHAMRVLPGFPYDAKMRVMERIAERQTVGFLIVVNAAHIGKKVFWDRQMEYSAYALEMAKTLGRYGGLYFFINFWDGSERARAFKRKAERLGKVWVKGRVEGYPAVEKALQAFEAGPPLAFEEEVVIVTAPGPNSGKMFAALMALYWAGKEGKATYAKYETFPVWNLPLESAVNKAYEAATAELGDYNVIDPFHLSAYGERAVNYNRDVESFRVLKPLAEELGLGYKSPTDMGINRVGFHITDRELCEEAARREINRRVFSYRAAYLMGKVKREAVERVEQVAKEAGVGESYREVVREARKGEVALRSVEGVFVKRKGRLMDGVAKALLEAGKRRAGTAGDVLDERVVKALEGLRERGWKRGRLDLTEVVMALAITAEEGRERAQQVLKALEGLRGSDLHALYPLDRHVVSLLTRMGIGVSYEV